MSDVFTGFPAEGLKFLRALKRNNDRTWFQPRKEQFEAVLRQPMLRLIGEVNEDLMRFAPDYVTDPHKAIFRIYRDTRFSNDKTPYKTHIAAVFSHRSLPRNLGAGFYFQVATDKVGVGGGIYRPGTDILKKLRAHFAENHAAILKEMGGIERRGKAGPFEGEQMSRVPKGFDPDHPAERLLRYRSLFFYDQIPVERALDGALRKDISARFKEIARFVALLDIPLVGSRKTTFEPAF